jgi:hypothetical protein
MPVGATFENVLVDFTVSGVHTKEAQKVAFVNNTDDKYKIPVAELAQKGKDDKYGVFDHNNHIIGFAMNSRGGLSPAATELVYRCYKRSTIKNPRSWTIEAMRVSLQKRFLDSLSCLLAKHRTLDYTFMGIPSRQRQNGFQHAPPMNVIGPNGNRTSDVINADAVQLAQQIARRVGQGRHVITNNTINTQAGDVASIG